MRMLLLIQPLRSRKYGRVRSGEPTYGKSESDPVERDPELIGQIPYVSMSVPVTSTA